MMNWITVLSVFGFLVVASDGLEIPMCIQIPQYQIFDGNTVKISGDSRDWSQVMGFKCNYTIAVPRDLSAKIFVLGCATFNNPNDHIYLAKMNEEARDLKDIIDDCARWTGFVLPGNNMMVGIVISQRYSTTQFWMKIEYHSVKVQSPTPMKTGGEMNFLDTSTLRDNSSLMTYMTFSANEPIVGNLATPMTEDYSLSTKFSYQNCFIIDGTLENNNGFWNSLGYDVLQYETTGNFITIATFTDFPLKFGFDFKSTLAPFAPYSSTNRHIPVPTNSSAIFPQEEKTTIHEIINFERVGITLDVRYVTPYPKCNSFVVSGPPNNSSKVLLDISTKPAEPHYFDLQGVTIISTGCIIDFNVY